MCDASSLLPATPQVTKAQCERDDARTQARKSAEEAAEARAEAKSLRDALTVRQNTRQPLCA